MMNHSPEQYILPYLRIAKKRNYERWKIMLLVKATMKALILISGFMFSFSSMVLAQNVEKQPLPLENLKISPGFIVSVFADNVPSARQMTMGDKGTIFVGTRVGGKVYAVVDQNKDYVADKVYEIAAGLNFPNGVAFRDGSLYIAEIHRIIRLDNIEDSLKSPPQPVVVSDRLPSDRWHGWKYIKFGPDGKLYVPVGAPCNVCENKDPRYASLLRMDPDGSNLEVFAKGIRNTVGFDWHPQSKELWFTDNGRDNLGDDLPPDELNHASRSGMHFGFPYCHGKEISDPEFGHLWACEEFTPATVELQPHGASLGMLFYTGKMFPPAFKDRIFIAEHGSWNRSEKVGYRVSVVRIKEDGEISYGPIVQGWHKKEDVWGRPVDLLQMPDGSLLISDDYAGVIYRLSF